MAKSGISLNETRVQALKRRGRTKVERLEPGERRRRKFAEKRQFILETALSIFSQFGYHGTSIEQIASDAGISKTNLFYYVKSKDELYLTILENILKDWLAPIGQFDINDEPHEALEQYIRRKLELSRDQPEASKLFCLEIIQGAPILKGYLTGELKQLIDEKTKVIDGWIQQGKMKPIEPIHLIFMIWATTQHYADFNVQIKALTGKDLKNKAFFEETCQSIQQIILAAISVK